MVGGAVGCSGRDRVGGGSADVAGSAPFFTHVAHRPLAAPNSTLLPTLTIMRAAGVHLRETCRRDTVRNGRRHRMDTRVCFRYHAKIQSAHRSYSSHLPSPPQFPCPLHARRSVVALVGPFRIEAYFVTSARRARFVYWLSVVTTTPPASSLQPPALRAQPAFGIIPALCWLFEFSPSASSTVSDL